MKRNVLSLLKTMRHSSVLNYRLPGVTSYLIGDTPSHEDHSTHGCVRLFTSDRNTDEWVTPHSRKYNFSALILEGNLQANTYIRAQSVEEYSHLSADPYWVSFLETEPNKDNYTQTEGYGPVSFTFESRDYQPGEWFDVDHKTIHSLKFTRGASVIVFEGPDVINHSVILEPFANGRRVPTFTVAPWMFQGA